MTGSWTFTAILIVVAVVPFALLGLVRLVAWAVPESARRLAEIERRHHTAYWTVVAVAYALVGIRHVALGGGEPLFGVFFFVMVVAAAVRGARKPRPSAW